MKTIPNWRVGVPAGMSLASAKAAAAAMSDGTSNIQLPTSSVEPGKSVPPAMQQILRASVRDRWLSSQLSYFTTQIVENTLRGAMSGNLLAQWMMFDLMEQTWPRLNKNLNELKNAVIDLQWNVQPFALKGKKPSAEAIRRADAAERLLWNMRPAPDADEADFEDTLYDCMDAVGKGIAVSEVHWMAPDDPDNHSGLWAPRATKWVHPRYYGYPPSTGAGIEDRLMLNMQEVKFSNPDARIQIVEGGGDLSWVNGQYARFPRDQFIISIVKQKSGHPISGAMLRILGFWWAASNFAWEWFLNLAQIFGVPIRWCTYATGTGGADTIKAIEDMMANLGSAGWGAFPEGTKIEIIKALESARDNPAQGFIQAADMIADTLILGQTLTTSQGERGSQALGTIHKSVRDEKIQSVGKRTAKCLNGQWMPAICRINFGDDRECPWLQPASKEGKATNDVATRWKTILGIPGVKVSKQQFYEENELVMPEEGEDVLEGQAAGAAGQEQGAKSQGQGGDDETPTAAVARGKGATEQLVNRVLEDLTGVEQKWLGGVKPFFRGLVATALSGKVTDAEFVAALERARKEMPELFSKLNHTALAKAMEEAMGAAVVNGAVRGELNRRKPR